jgi:hypothetical protein
MNKNHTLRDFCKNYFLLAEMCVKMFFLLLLVFCIFIYYIKIDIKGTVQRDGSGRN